MGTWIPFLSYVFVTSFTPGPNNIMAMTNANQYGFWKTMKFTSGVFAGFFVLMLLSSYLNEALATQLPGFSLLMRVVGAAYMLYLALKIVKSSDEARSKTKETLNSFWAGFGLQFLNPKAILYGITVVGNFVIPFSHSHASLVMFSVLLAAVGFLSTGSWALFGVLFQRLLSNYRRPFNLAMGGLLIYCAIAMFL